MRRALRPMRSKWRITASAPSTRRRSVATGDWRASSTSISRSTDA